MLVQRGTEIHQSSVDALIRLSLCRSRCKSVSAFFIVSHAELEGSGSELRRL